MVYVGTRDVCGSNWGKCALYVCVRHCLLSHRMVGEGEGEGGRKYMCECLGANVGCMCESGRIYVWVARS